MKNLLMIAAVACGLGLLSGCFIGEVKTREPSRSYAPPPTDNRPIGDITRENTQLRERLAKLEKDCQGWQAAVNNRETEKDGLKRQRDEVKKDRDRWKRAAKRD